MGQISTKSKRIENRIEAIVVQALAQGSLVGSLRPFFPVAWMTLHSVLFFIETTRTKQKTMSQIPGMRSFPLVE
jgi:hypothetical protein